MIEVNAPWMMAQDSRAHPLAGEQGHALGLETVHDQHLPLIRERRGEQRPLPGPRTLTDTGHRTQLSRHQLRHDIDAESALWLAAAIAVGIEHRTSSSGRKPVRPHAASPWRAGNREPYGPSCELMHSSLHARAGACRAALRYRIGPCISLPVVCGDSL